MKSNVQTHVMAWRIIVSHYLFTIELGGQVPVKLRFLNTFYNARLQELKDCSKCNMYNLGYMKRLIIKTNKHTFIHIYNIYRY